MGCCTQKLYARYVYAGYFYPVKLSTIRPMPTMMSQSWSQSARSRNPMNSGEGVVFSLQTVCGGTS